ncbi:HEAT repeat domain-containing protein, partial [Gilliamella apicola]|uniref:HEAT repeat domain-containing protein n=1 Tax=Gilliamella apicola TaxID=1196095 RepID=UPI002FEE08B5
MNEIEQLSPEQLINTIFKPLSELDKSLPERVTQYILHSDEIDVLADFDKLCQNSANVDKIYDLLRGPYGRFSSWDECELKTNASIQGRIDFYKLWTDAYTPEQIIRYARFSAILFDHSSQIKRISEQIPSWLRYLLYDGLITTLLSYSENKDKIEGRENWSIQQLHQFLEIEQAGLGEKLLFAIFERQNIFEDYLPDFQYFTRLNGLLTYIQERIDLFKQLPSLGLAPLGQVEQLNFIQRYPQLQLQLVDFLIMQTLNTYKQVSQSATAILFSLPLDIVQPQLQHFLTSGSVKLRTNAAILLSRIISEPTILQQALTNETNKPVIAALESALLKLEIANAAKQQAHLVIPDFEPIIDTPLPITARDVIQQNFDEFLIKCKKSLQKAIEENKENIRSWEEYCKKLQSLTSNSLDDIFDYVNGKINLSALFKKLDNKIGFYFLLINNRLLNIPEFSLFHLFRIRGLIHNQNYTNFFEKIYENYDVIKKFELRQITDVLKKINIIPNVEYTIALKFLTNDYYHDIYENEPYKLWTFFAENEFLIDEALGFAPLQITQFYNCIDKVCAIKILKLFPSIPVKYVAYLFELALGESKQLRYAAQDALKLLPNIHNQVEQALSSPKQEVRIVAANWLAELGKKRSIKALNAALKKEKRETVQAAILVALEKMGEDISQHLTQKKLLVDAQKGLKGKMPTDLNWFDFNLIPTLTWQNGKAVDPQIIQWWICLAVKLKDPANPLLIIYTRLLSNQSQQQLGIFILQSFINKDTRKATLEEAEAKANSEADIRLQQYIAVYKNYLHLYPHFNNITYEQVFDEIKKETLAAYVGSAIKAKGMLALITGIEGRVAVSLLRSFMKNHYIRRAQIEAMLESLANSDDPMIIQLLLSLARRYRMASIQEKARYLVESIAERLGWTTDELA